MTTPPATVTHEIEDLRAAVAGVVPPRADDNLLIATWNLRAFADVAATWAATAATSPKRDWRAVACVAAIVQAFDVVAVQEVRRDTRALHFLLDQLGPSWRVITSDVTEGDAGNGERLTFVFDADRVTPSGLVGEIVLPPGVDGSRPVQFARTPYAVSFTRSDVELILTTVHVMWGQPENRLPEIQAFAQWMRAWADRHDDWNRNLLVLGDFNLDRKGNPLFDAFHSTGLSSPTELDAVPRTIFDDAKTQHFYDQIAWFSDAQGRSTLDELTFTHHAGMFDFLSHVFPGLTKTEVSWRISDHYPLWVEFTV
jgi:endonuclease/exonuclease/phosphatase family metal-dependent hydrolase